MDGQEAADGSSYCDSVPKGPASGYDRRPFGPLLREPAQNRRIWRQGIFPGALAARRGSPIEGMAPVGHGSQ